MKRKLLYILLTLSLLSLLFTGCKEDTTSLEQKQLINEPRWVTSDSGLRIRERPVDGDTVEIIPYKGEVLLLEETGEDVTIADETGKWSRIKYGETEGWVFGGFLSKQIPQEVTEDINELLIGAWNKVDTWYISVDEKGNQVIMLTDNNFAFYFFEENFNYQENYGYGVKKGTWKYLKDENVIVVNDKYKYHLVEITQDEMIIINTSHMEQNHEKYKKVIEQEQINNLLNTQK